MKFLVNYSFVLFYYSIGVFISLKYLALYILQLIGGKKDVPVADLEEPKSLQDIDFDEKTSSFIVDGKEVHFKYVSKGSPKNPLMLFLNGFPEFWYIWKHQMIEFSNEYWTVALELNNLDKKSSDRQFLVEFVKTVLDDLNAGRRSVLIGRDIGGSLIWSFLDKYPELVGKAIIINAPHPEAFKRELKTFSQVVKSSTKMFYLLPKLPEWSFQRNNLQKIDTLVKCADVSEDDSKILKYYFKKNDFGNIKNGLNFYRSNFINDVIFKTHNKVSNSESYPQVLVLYTKSNEFYNDKCFLHNYVKESIQCTEIQTKHGHFFQFNEKSSKNLNQIIKNYFENPNKWENIWSDDKVTSGIILKENFDENEDKEGKKEDVFDNLIKQCNDTIENIKEDIKEIGDKKKE